MIQFQLNDIQEKLWNDLMTLVRTNEAFYYVDQKIGYKTYRIFSYRLASYTDFLQPNALECRGHMFEVSCEGDDAQPLRMASWVLPKFFNKDENPFTMDLNYNNPKQVMLKMDGSLISTFMHNNKVRLKSKTSLSSDQAVAAQKFLDSNEMYRLRFDIDVLVRSNFTVIMEWTTPDNRIVIGYEKPNLTVLAVRHNGTGGFAYKEGFSKSTALQEHWVETFDIADMNEFVASIPTMQGIEGYVLQLANSQFVKIKTLAYLSLHHAKDSINSPRRLYETVLDEASDDLRSLFAEDPLAIKQIGEMEQRVEKIYNHLVNVVETYYKDNKDLDRKSYAVKGQQELTGLQFKLAMDKYLGRDVSYKEFMKKRWKEFGIKEEVKEE